MKRFFVAVASFALVSSLTSDPAAAQLPGNPVYAALPSVGITLSGDYGMGLVTDESARTDFFGGRLQLGLPAFSLWVSGGAYDSWTGPGMEITMGGGVALNVLKARSLPVSLSLQAGGGTLPCGSGCTTINAFAGPALKLNVAGAVDIFHPWIMPRVHVTRFNVSGGYRDQVGFGGSGGFAVNLPFGLGIHGAIDFSIFEETTSDAIFAERRSPLVVGGGLHYLISIPGLGGL